MNELQQNIDHNKKKIEELKAERDAAVSECQRISMDENEKLRAEVRAKEELLKKKSEENADLLSVKLSAEAKVAQLKVQLAEAEEAKTKMKEEGFSSGWDLALWLVLHRDPQFPRLDVEDLLSKGGDEVQNPSAAELEVIAELDRREASEAEAFRPVGMNLHCEPDTKSHTASEA